MVDPLLNTVIRDIHDSPIQAALVASGAGSQALAWLMSIPGATRTILEVTLPYSYASFERFVGFRPEHFVSSETAVLMAKVAYRRARLLAPDGTPSVGLACTATLVTDRPKRGEHRCHIALRDERGITTYSLVLNKGMRDRSGEEEVVSRLLVKALAAACGCSREIPLGLLPGEHVETVRIDAPDLVLQVLRGELNAIIIDISGQLSTGLPENGVILPGAFNPFHGGHAQLAYVAGQITGRPVYFELSVHNVDKPPLLEADVRQRLEQFYGHGSIIVTTAPLFEQKAALFPNSIFVVGYDTARRLVSPEYYKGSDRAMRHSLDVIRAHDCRFLVAGRLQDGQFHTLADIQIPHGYENLFEPIPPDVFRTDISSTDLRAQSMNGLSHL